MKKRQSEEDTSEKSTFGKLGVKFDFMRHLDLFGQEYKFTLDREDKFKTKVGAMWSIFAVAFTTLLCIITLKRMFDTRNPTTHSAVTIEMFPPKRDLYKHKYSMAVGAFLDDGQHIPVDQLFRYGTPMLMMMELTLKRIEFGEIGFEVKHFWEFKPCKDIEDT